MLVLLVMVCVMTALVSGRRARKIRPPSISEFLTEDFAEEVEQVVSGRLILFS